MINRYRKNHLNKYILWDRDTTLPTHMLGADVYLYPTGLEIKFTDGNSRYECTDDKSAMQYLAKAKHYKGITTVYGLGRPVYMGYGKITNKLSEILS